MSRQSRKLDHIKYALKSGQSGETGLDDIKFVHNSLPQCSLDEIDLTVKMGELFLSSPIFINAMTGGGGKQTEGINRQMAIAAHETGIGLAVGSQMSAVKDRAEESTYKVVREENPRGFIIGNLGGEATVEQAKKAVDMIEADALQIHLNVIQELTMPEGDRDFRQTMRNIEKIVRQLEVPVIVKEVGFGMSRETVSSLKDIGVTMVDISGAGGTNFSVIENSRRSRLLSYFDGWGISTAASIMEAGAVDKMDILASGGIRTGLDIAKCMALGAKGVGFAGHFLKIQHERGAEGLIEEIQNLQQDLRYIMTALGARTVDQLSAVPKVISGETYHWLGQRGIIE
ncbi:MAG: type 2 isopentenyl-diphosphate Delta-isomerase [Bacillus sp. (in: firmicutes)]